MARAGEGPNAMCPPNILFCYDDEVRVTSERIEFFGNALPVRGITAAKVVECRTSLVVRGLLLALPPLLLALGLTLVTQVPPPAGAFGWGFAVLGMALGGVVMVGRHQEPRFELRATARGLEIPVFSHLSRDTVEKARTALLRAVAGIR